MFINNTYSKSSPEKTGGLNIKHKQVQHVLEHFDTFHECKKIWCNFWGKNLSNELKLLLLIKLNLVKMMMISKFAFNIAICVKTVKHWSIYGFRVN